MTYASVIYVHTLIGFTALFSFWVAALSPKGQRLHRRAGKWYLASMIVILASIVPMIVVKAQMGDVPFCVLLGFLFSIAFTASLIIWHSIQAKKNAAAYFNPMLRGVTAFLFLYAMVILFLGIRNGSFLQVVFSGVGLVLGGSVWYHYQKKERPKNWYLAQHLNGAAVAFAATHGSFLRFGLAGFLSLPDSPALNTFAQTSMILLALALRLWVGGQYLRRRKKKAVPVSVVAYPKQEPI